ncbi:MAG: hypothetical protein CSA29_01440 [Desulfobacterales bacterium]|nr:MAG: hypothetical protein CSA29_01440 [Desulfobacterales bacterium]
MFSFFFKKEKKVERLIYAYLKNFNLSCKTFENALFSCINDPYCEEFNFLRKQTHKYESKADDLKNELNNLMYGKILIPDSREDIMRLVLALDKIPSILDAVLSMIKYQHLVLPDEMLDDFQALTKASMKACRILPRQVNCLLKKEKGIREFMNKVDEKESYCDHIEKKLIKWVFQSDIDPFLKLQLRDLIAKLGDISDQADRVSKRINILALKRQV